MSIANIYHLRRVAETASKPCYICYKQTTSVLNQADGKDWFYTCSGHLLDRGFAQPIVSQEEEEAKKKKEELEKEIEKVKQEYEEKQKAKKKKKDKDKNKEEKKKDAKEEKERDEKIKSLEDQTTAASKSSDGPRIYALHKNIYQMRVDRIKNAQRAKQTQVLLRDPKSFPAAPKGDLG